MRVRLGHRSTLLLGALCLVGCTPTSIEERDELLERAHASPATAVASLSRLHARYGLPINYWPDSALSDSLVRAGAEGPCGPESTQWVKRLRPAPARHSLDDVIEYDDAKVIQTWRFPANNVPQGIRGTSLIHVPIWYRDSMRLDSASVPVVEVALTGALRVAKLGGRLPVPKMVECPAHAAQPKSDFWSCHEFVDLTSSRRRYLAFNGVCT